jgi:hypothetical protein
LFGTVFFPFELSEVSPVFPFETNRQMFIKHKWKFVEWWKVRNTKTISGFFSRLNLNTAGILFLRPIKMYVCSLTTIPGVPKVMFEKLETLSEKEGRMWTAACYSPGQAGSEKIWLEGHRVSNVLCQHIAIRSGVPKQRRSQSKCVRQDKMEILFWPELDESLQLSNVVRVWYLNDHLGNNMNWAITGALSFVRII